jgi:hypothetical protein
MHGVPRLLDHYNNCFNGNCLEGLPGKRWADTALYLLKKVLVGAYTVAAGVTVEFAVARRVCAAVR